MGTMIVEVYDALRAANVPEERARAAAEALTEHRDPWLRERFESVERGLQEIDRRFEGIDRHFEAVDRRFDEVERRLGRVEGDVDRVKSDVAELRSDVRILKWGQGITLAGVIAILVRVLLP